MVARRSKRLAKKSMSERYPPNKHRRGISKLPLRQNERKSYENVTIDSGVYNSEGGDYKSEKTGSTEQRMRLPDTVWPVLYMEPKTKGRKTCYAPGDEIEFEPCVRFPNPNNNKTSISPHSADIKNQVPTSNKTTSGVHKQCPYLDKIFKQEQSEIPLIRLD